MAESNPIEVSHQITVPAVGSADAIEVDALYEVAQNPVAQCILAHGAGAGLTHSNMQQLSAAFVEHCISTLR